MSTARPLVWLLLDRSRIPARLESRVIDLGLLHLGSEEVDHLLYGSTSHSSDEERLQALLELGLGPAEIARRLHVSRRTVYRRMQKLKERKET